MRSAFSTAVLLFLPAITAAAQAQPGRGQGEHRQPSGPAQQQARPMQQQARPAQQQRPIQQQARPAGRQQVPNALPPQQSRRQQALPSQQQQAHPVGGMGRGNAWGNARAPQSPRARENQGGHAHGRISSARYESRFGREHSFHVNRGDYDHRRFRYGGYAFGFVDPWPMGWGYSDDVYVEYTDDGYFMYNRFHPGVRISINIL
jgi:hypothetical protein